ncbi:SRPBCC domain-containing protein [Nocardiopsis quinghaiensis]|uniref:SRPBCC domain-containing protein n=1 Tax=Nocardiopsis quinghaiensis TaxID=464995 RepID=UPI001238F854|nr:SRPBCC domain-containing protein [Nocardiopsis quinghaiensis]
MGEAPDRIERQVDVAASARRVWDLVTRPGWFVNDEEIADHQITPDGDADIVHDPVHGAFRIRAERLEPHGYAAFRWFCGDGGGSTLVEFWIEERDAGGVTLRVAESGFTSLEASEEDRRVRFEGDAVGWEMVLSLAAAHVEASR